MKVRREIVALVCLVFVFGFGLDGSFLRGVEAAEQPIKLKVLSSWGTEQSYTRLFLVPFVERVNKRAAGSLELSWVGPEAVPPFQQLKPLQAGLFDIVYTHPAYHMGEIALGISMDLIKGSPAERRAAGFYPVLDEGYKKVNGKVLGLNCMGVGYMFMLKKPIQKADFSGLKLRTTPSYEPLVKALNGASVNIASAEIYSALEKGVVDGAAQTAFAALDLKLYEVAPYQLRPLYGEVTEYLLVNVNTWAKLPQKAKDLLTTVTKELEEEARNELIAKWKTDEADLLKKGMKLNVLPPKEADKFLKAYYESSWEEIVLKHSPELGRKLKTLTDKFVKTHPQD